MVLLDEARKRAKQIVIPVVGAAVVGYFVYHTVQGDRGLSAYLSLNQEANRARVVLAGAQGERAILERRSRLLRPDSLDLDMLEERARMMLNLVHADDLVVFDGTAR